MAKTEGSAGERAELYQSIAEEAKRRNIGSKSVCEERGVSYNAVSVFRSRQHRKDNDGIMVKRDCAGTGSHTGTGQDQNFGNHAV